MKERREGEEKERPRGGGERRSEMREMLRQKPRKGWRGRLSHPPEEERGRGEAERTKELQGEEKS